MVRLASPPAKRFADARGLSRQLQLEQIAASYPSRERFDAAASGGRW